MKIISAILILATIFFSIKNGWGLASGNLKPEQAKMLSDLGIGKLMMTVLGILTLSVAVLIIFPETFFIANFINGALLLSILLLQLRDGNIKGAIIEIPFLILPMIIVYLGYPLKK